MDLQLLAAQLRKPEGETGIQVGRMMNNGNRVINKMTLDLLELRDSHSILEIGMGNGGLLDDLFHYAKNFTYTGVDYAPLMVAEATAANRQHVDNGTMRFLEANAAALPFEKGSFDRVFTVNTVYFWAEPQVQLMEIRRVLKAGGIFSIGIRTKETMDLMPFTRFGFTKYDVATLSELLQSNGFRILQCKEMEEPPYPFEGEELVLRNGIISCTPAPSGINDNS